METKQLTTKDLFNQDNVKKKFEELLGKKAPAFITSVLQAVASNAMLKDAEPNSVYHAAAVAATLDLPINNSIGFAYIVPYKDGKSGKTLAQFQMGYRGFIQLAQRSGQFKTISDAPIYEGQLVSEDPLKGFVFDFTKRTSDKIIGYASYMELLNGFSKTWYASVEELKAHGMRYSQSAKKGFGLWKDDFDAMARKTSLKMLLSKYAPLSIEMQSAVKFDQATINDNGEAEYVDAPEVEPIALPLNENQTLIDSCATWEELEELKTNNPDDKELCSLATAKQKELGGKK